VSEVDFDFVPATITISVGDTIVWTNNGASPHTSTSTSTESWDSGTMNPGATFSHTFGTAGSFPYFCSFHSDLGMTGTVVVAAGGGGGGTLPSTGASDTIVPFAWVGLLFLLTGGVVLYLLRRRRA
jgi:LPXTG-motif cell wall-anchored protein